MSFHKSAMIYFIAIYFFATKLDARKPGEKFPHLVEFDSIEIKKPVYRFDGLDYDELPEPIKTEYSDCHAHYLRCIRFKTEHNPVCAVDMRDWYVTPYINQCEVNFDNCKGMVAKGRDMKGTEPRTSVVLYVGEGLNCEFRVRAEDGDLIQRMKKSQNFTDKILSNHPSKLLLLDNTLVKSYPANQQLKKKVIVPSHTNEQLRDISIYPYPPNQGPKDMSSHSAHINQIANQQLKKKAIFPSHTNEELRDTSIYPYPPNQGPKDMSSHLALINQQYKYMSISPPPFNQQFKDMKMYPPPINEHLNNIPGDPSVNEQFDAMPVRPPPIN